MSFTEIKKNHNYREAIIDISIQLSQLLSKILNPISLTLKMPLNQCKCWSKKYSWVPIVTFYGPKKWGKSKLILQKSSSLDMLLSIKTFNKTLRPCNKSSTQNLIS